jgi:hypothetical protein
MGMEKSILRMNKNKLVICNIMEDHLAGMSK